MRQVQVQHYNRRQYDAHPPRDDLAMAYNPTGDNVLVGWQDHGHYSEGEAGHWGIWGRIWAPVERVLLPLVLKSWP